MKFMYVTMLALMGLFTCGQRNAVNVTEAAQAPVALLEAGSANISWDTMLRDFGDITNEDGPQSCTFTLTNNGEEPVYIYEVVSSCGCTDVKWERKPVKAGESATISATYKNEDGPGAFDKTLTVYISGVKKPVILRIRGVVHEKKKSLSQLYGAERLGDFGMKTLRLKAPGIKQGQQVSETVNVANLGKNPLKVEFTGVSSQLEVKVTPNPIPAGSTAQLTYTLSSDPQLWGKNDYYATPVLNGQTAAKRIEVSAITQDNFSLLSQKEKNDAAMPVFRCSTYEYGIVQKGNAVEGEFAFENKGRTTLHFHKADTENQALELYLPEDTEAGAKGVLHFKLDTSKLPEGESVIMFSLITNSPLRPLVNLFVAGVVKL